MPINLKMAIALLLASAAVLVGVQVAVQSVDPALIDPDLQGIWALIVYIFTTSSMTPFWTFIRNIYGFAENWFEANPEDRKNIQYESQQLFSTYIKYEGYIKAFGVVSLALTANTPLAPYATLLAGAMAFITDLIRKSLADLSK